MASDIEDSRPPATVAHQPVVPRMKTYEDLIASYLQQVDEGQAVDVQGFVESNPEHAGQLRKFFSNIGVVDDLVRIAKPKGVSESDKLGKAHYVDPVSTGQRVGKYLVHEIVGFGAFGTVYRATDVELQREVALKVPRPDVVFDSGSLRRFQSEATTAANLDHPMIVPVLDAQLEGSRPYIATAFCDGPDLGEWLARQTEPIDAQQAAAFVAKLANAVHYAHEHGVLHRDLKPGNVMVESVSFEERDRCHETNGRLALLQPRLTDFGLAKFVEEALHSTRSSTIVGTPFYMAPEQVTGIDVGAQADVYSLGLILHEILFGIRPFEGQSVVELVDRFRGTQPIELPAQPDVPTDLRTICERCLQFDVRDRYQTAGEVANDLQLFLDGESPRAKPVGILAKFRQFTSMPVRLKQAAHSAVIVQASVLVSFAFILIMKAVGARTGIAGEVSTLFHEVVQMCICPTLPVLLLGLLTLRRQLWAFTLNCVFVIIMLGLVCNSLITGFSPLSFYHDNELATFAAHSLLLGVSVAQVGLHLLAIPAAIRIYNQQQRWN